MNYVLNRVEVVDATKVAVMGLVFTATLMFNGWSGSRTVPIIRLVDTYQDEISDDTDDEKDKTIYKVAFHDGHGNTTDVSIDVRTGKVVEVVTA